MKRFYLRSQLQLELVRQHLARAKVVAVGEAAGEDDNLVVGEARWKPSISLVDVASCVKAPACWKADAVSSSRLVPGARSIRTFTVLIYLPVQGLLPGLFQCFEGQR